MRRLADLALVVMLLVALLLSGCGTLAVQVVSPTPTLQEAAERSPTRPAPPTPTPPPLPAAPSLSPTTAAASTGPARYLGVNQV